MATFRDNSAENAWITRRLAELLGVDPAVVSTEGFTAEWADGQPVQITWRGFMSLPLDEWEAILDVILNERKGKPWQTTLGR